MSDNTITCDECGAVFSCARILSPVQRHRRLAYLLRTHECRAERPDLTKNFSVACLNCHETPTVGTTGLCGPCYFGQLDAREGHW